MNDFANILKFMQMKVRTMGSFIMRPHDFDGGIVISNTHNIDTDADPMIMMLDELIGFPTIPHPMTDSSTMYDYGVVHPEGDKFDAVTDDLLINPRVGAGRTT